MRYILQLGEKRKHSYWGASDGWNVVCVCVCVCVCAELEEGMTLVREAGANS